MDNEQLARFHFETVLKLVSKETVESWLSGIPIPVPVKSNRGRRPGAATDADRCAWKFSGGEQCKNTKCAENIHCKMHIKKVHLIED